MVYSALGGMGAAVCCHPLDTMRVSMQVSEVKRSSVGTLKHLVRTSGVGGLYNGITAAFLRQWTYGACRVGIYSWLLAKDKAASGGVNPSLGKKMAMGTLSGGIGSFVGTPSELALVRMTADSRLPVEERRGYTSVVNCLTRIAKEEGLPNLWKGSLVTIIRASVLSAVMLGSSSEIKVQLPHYSGGKLGVNDNSTFMIATVVGSFFSTAASQPFDVVKSRIQNMPAPKPGEDPIYKNMVHCARTLVLKEGPISLMKGFTPSFIKIAPYQVISLFITERITQMLTGTSAI